MKKVLPIFAIGMLALAACDKGSVSGTVIDPFTGNAVELSTVWIEGTIHNSQKKIPGGLPDGKFKFEGLEPGTYILRSGKGQYLTGRAEFTVSKDNSEISQNIFIYSQKVTPGLYRTIADSSAVKITNDWALWQPTCKESGFVLRSKFVEEVENPKTKKKEKKDRKLADPKEVPSNTVTFLYKIATSVSSPIEAVSYPIKNSSAKNHADCGGVDAKETLLIPDSDKGTKLQSGYKSENLYEIILPLPSGKQFLTISQDGKQVGLYYLNVNAQ